MEETALLGSFYRGTVIPPMGTARFRSTFPNQLLRCGGRCSALIGLDHVFHPGFEVGTTKTVTPENSECPRRGHIQTLSSREAMADLKGELREFNEETARVVWAMVQKPTRDGEAFRARTVGNQYHSLGARGGSYDELDERGSHRYKASVRAVITARGAQPLPKHSPEDRK